MMLFLDPAEASKIATSSAYLSSPALAILTTPDQILVLVCS